VGVKVMEKKRKHKGKICDRCKGSGKLDYKTICEWCNGKGWVKNE
jgi:DnaJ-class molecular chaperone